MKSKTIHAPQESSRVQGWRLSTRVAFRFAFVYLGLYSLISHVLIHLFLPPNTMPGQGLGVRSPMVDITSWAAVHIFGITGPLIYTGNSRDTEFFWVQAFLVLFIAVSVTVAWSLLDRRREDYITLHKWFRLFIRMAVAAQMFYFGMVKVIPTQFPSPSLLTLIAPVGNLSLQGLIWTATGASPPYQILTGLVEVLAGLLLLAPRTTMLGAAICLASMVHVLALNMTYDIGVKILSFQLVLMAVFLLSPDFPRLANLFLFNHPTGRSTEAELFGTRRANRIAQAVQIAFGIYLLGMYGILSQTFWYSDGGGGSAKSALYGIWNVEELAVDGAVQPAELNDYDRRWRRVIFDAPQWIFFQRTDDSFIRYGVNVDAERNTLALTKGRSRNWSSSFTFERPTRDRMLVEGEMDGYRISMKLQLVEFDTFRLLNSHFRWVRPPDPETQ